MMTYSTDFRKKVLWVKEEKKLTFGEVSERFCVGVSSVVRWSKNIESKGKRNKKATKLNWEELLKDVEAHPDSYQYERAQRFGVSRQGIAYALKRLNISYKKKPLSTEKQMKKRNKHSKTK